MKKPHSARKNKVLIVTRLCPPKTGARSRTRHAPSLAGLFLALLAAVTLTTFGLPSPATAVARLGRTVVFNPINALSGFFSVTVTHKKKAESFDAVLIVQRPNLLFLQILDDLADERLRLVADGSQLLYYDPSSRKTELLPQDAEVLKKALRLPLSVEAFIERMTLFASEAEILELEENPENGESVLQIRRAHDRLETRGAPLRLSRYETGPKIHKGKFKYRVFYRDYATQNASAQAYPRVIEWQFKKPKIDVVMQTQKIDFFVRSPQSRFDTSQIPEAAESDSP